LKALVFQCFRCLGQQGVSWASQESSKILKSVPE
jgi:hypothetical protein